MNPIITGMHTGRSPITSSNTPLISSLVTTVESVVAVANIVKPSLLFYLFINPHGSTSKEYFEKFVDVMQKHDNQKHHYKAANYLQIPVYVL
jgi:hypothetical protein